MTYAPTCPPTRSRPGEPVWEIAELFPEQGSWTEQEYLALQTNHLVEFDNGTIQMLPLPTKTHQLILQFFYKLLEAFVAAHKLGGTALVAPYRLRVPKGKFREPDVLYMTSEQNARAGEDFTEAAQLVGEVVSEDDPDRDYVTKRSEYARVGVPEYWIIDRVERQVLVLRLKNRKYAVHGRFLPGQQATSHVLPDFEVAVDRLLSAGM
jgi:Uma2 family endonuclease